MSAGIWVHSYSVTPPRRGQIFGNSRWLSSESDVMAHDHDVMVEAVNHIWLLFNIHPCQTYIVLCHLLMMSVCILWVHPYTVTPINLDQSLQFWGHCQVEMMPQCHGLDSKPTWSSSHINIICIQSVSAPWYAVDGGWAYVCALTLLCLCRSGEDFRKIGVGRSSSDVVMSWLRLQTHLEFIPHPFYMYTQCFSTLICCGWACVCALTLLCLCRSWEDWILGKLGKSGAWVML